MTVVRRHLRRGVTAWLLCHALTFTALVPRDCCAAHADAADVDAGAETPPCHETAAPAETPAPFAHCDMAAAEGAACPMHAAEMPATDCSMTGVCHAPEAALAAVLLHAAVAVPPFTLASHSAAGVLVADAAVSPASLAIPPDAPPPRR